MIFAAVVDVVFVAVVVFIGELKNITNFGINIHQIRQNTFTKTYLVKYFLWKEMNKSIHVKKHPKFNSVINC